MKTFLLMAMSLAATTVFAAQPAAAGDAEVRAAVTRSLPWVMMA